MLLCLVDLWKLDESISNFKSAWCIHFYFISYRNTCTCRHYRNTCTCMQRVKILIIRCVIRRLIWMDGWVRILRPFNSISVISRRWEGEHEILCAMKRRLGSGRISPPAGFKPATPWSKVGRANRSATPTLRVWFGPALFAYVHFYRTLCTSRPWSYYLTFMSRLTYVWEILQFHYCNVTLYTKKETVLQGWNRAICFVTIAQFFYFYFIYNFFFFFNTIKCLGSGQKPR